MKNVYLINNLIADELKKKQLERLKVKFNSDDKALDREIAGMVDEVYRTLSKCENNVKNIVQADYLTKPIEKISKQS